MSKNKIIILSFILYLTSEVYSLEDAKLLAQKAIRENNGKSFVYEVKKYTISPSVFDNLQYKIKNEKTYTISLFILENLYDEKNFIKQLDGFIHYGAESNYIVLIYYKLYNDERKISNSGETSKLNSKCFETANSKVSSFINEDDYLVKLIDSLIENKDFCLKSDRKNTEEKNKTIAKTNLIRIILGMIIIIIVVIIFCFVLIQIYNKKMNNAMGIPNQQYQNINYPQAQPGIPQNQNPNVDGELPILPQNNNNDLNNNYQTPIVNYQTPNVNYQTPNVNYQTPNVNYQTPNVNYQTPNVNYQQNQQNNLQTINNNNYPQNQQNNIPPININNYPPNQQNNFQPINNNNYPPNQQNNYQQFNNNNYPQNNYQVHQ